MFFLPSFKLTFFQDMVCPVDCIAHSPYVVLLVKTVNFCTWTYTHMVMSVTEIIVIDNQGPKHTIETICVVGCLLWMFVALISYNSSSDPSLDNFLYKILVREENKENELGFSHILNLAIA